MEIDESPRLCGYRGGGRDTLDYRGVIRSSRALSGELVVSSVGDRLLESLVELLGVRRALLLVERRGRLFIEAEAPRDLVRVAHVRSDAKHVSSCLSLGIARCAARAAQTILALNPGKDARFAGDGYLELRQPGTVLCTPISCQGQLLGVVYLEDDRPIVFTEARLEVVELLARQAVISIVNAHVRRLELEAEQAKIHPHFLFNALTSIADLAADGGSKAEAAVVELARLYRYITTVASGQLVTLEQELEVVRSYLALEQLRLGSKLAFAIACDERVAGVRVPGLLIQPLVENSVRHGIAPKLSAGRIAITAAATGDRCSITVHDDGQGAARTTPGAGLGLKSVRDRLALVYGPSHSFAIQRGDGCRVEMVIPLRGADVAGPEDGGERTSFAIDLDHC